MVGPDLCSEIGRDCWWRWVIVSGMKMSRMCNEILTNKNDRCCSHLFSSYTFVYIISRLFWCKNIRNIWNIHEYHTLVLFEIWIHMFVVIQNMNMYPCATRPWWYIVEQYINMACHCCMCFVLWLQPLWSSGPLLVGVLVLRAWEAEQGTMPVLSY